MDRVILHVDMDAFFASVEQKDNRDLKNKPVIVCGMGERGVVSTCSYEARKFGVHSAMPTFMAKNLCPNGIFIPVRMERYKEVSNKIFEIFRDVTEIIEPLSIDESFLDITNSRFEKPEQAAFYIKRKVKQELGLTLSIGISYNKFLAKLASDWNKPNGMMIINKDMVPDILLPLPLSKIFGLGKITVRKLNNMGLYKVQDLYELPKDFYIEYLGKNGPLIYDRIRGIDDRPLTVSRERKSIGKERTLKFDTLEKQELFKYLYDFSSQISELLIDKNFKGKTITLKYKSKSFENHTKSKTLNFYIYKTEDIYKVAKELFEEAKIKEEIRLIGLSISSFKENKIEQISFLKI